MDLKPWRATAEGFPTLFLGAHREISGKIFLIFLKISHFSQNFSNFSKFLKFLKFLKISENFSVFLKFLTFSWISREIERKLLSNFLY